MSLGNFVKIGIFFFIFQAYMTFKYIYVTFGMTNMNHYADVFNVTQYSQTHLLLGINVAKQYYFDPNILIFNNTDTNKVFSESLININNEVENMIQVI